MACVIEGATVRANAASSHFLTKLQPGHPPAEVQLLSAAGLGCPLVACRQVVGVPVCLARGAPSVSVPWWLSHDLRRPRTPMSRGGCSPQGGPEGGWDRGTGRPQGEGTAGGKALVVLRENVR